MIKSRQKLKWIQLLNERKCTGWELCLYSFSPEGYSGMLNVGCLELKQKYTAFYPEVSEGRIWGFQSSQKFRERRMFKRKVLQKEVFPNLHVNSPQILDIIWIMYMYGEGSAVKTLNREQKLVRWKTWAEILVVTYLRSNRVQSLNPIKLQSIGKHLSFCWCLRAMP